MIVKIQIPLYPPNSLETLVYNEDKSFQMNGDADPGLLELMNGRHKVFFNAEWNGKELKVGDEAPWQEW